VAITRRTFLKATAAIYAAELVGDQAAFAASSDIQHGSRLSKKVALTFHGAGNPDFAEQLLQLFKTTGTQVSVFAVGSWLVRKPTLASKIVAEGHDLGNHTMNHTQMKTISKSKIDSEIGDCANILKKQIGNHGLWFRPSGTQFSTPMIRAAVQKFGYGQCISYDVDSEDYKDVSTKTMISNVMNRVQNGSIISMHFGHKVTLEAMPNILEKLHARGLQPVALTDLLKI
jgi:peptidoglycan/xylan/chitin deacetylase (PgdA/CDA1 family)